MSESVGQPTDRAVCLIPQLSGGGGTVSFQLKMATGLSERGIRSTFKKDEAGVEAVLLVGGTRELLGLWKVRRRGIPIFQRLDGINWIHKKRRTGLRHYLKAERANLLLSWTRKNLATAVIYQSHFVHNWWERVYGTTAVQHAVIHNGVDLERYHPDGSNDRPTNAIRILMVEGRLAGGYEIGLEHAVDFAESLASVHAEPIELMVVGEAAEHVRKSVQARSNVPIKWAGSVSRDRIPHLDRSAHLLFAADIHPACPNAVIEALACGLPVVGFDTGALGEIVDDGAGRIVPYGADPWKLERPDFKNLARAAKEVLDDLAQFQRGARARAVAKFGLDNMVENYLEVIGW